MNTLPNKQLNWPHYQTITEGMYWPDGQMIPSFSSFEGPLDTMTLNYLSDDVKVTLTVLQGHVNCKKTRIFLNQTHAVEEGVNTWPERLHIERNEWTDLFAFLKKYLPEVDGAVLYREGQGVHMRNLASTVANIRHLVPVEAAFYDTLRDHGIDLPAVCDLTGLEFAGTAELYHYLYDNYWKDCTRRILISLNPSFNPSFLRDLGAAIGAAVIWLDARIPEEKECLDLFLKDLTPGKSINLGWWPEERSGIGEGTSFGISTIPSDSYENATVYAAFPHIMHIPPVPKKPELENKIYIALFMSDGDNVQYCQHWMSRLWGNKDRGSVPLNWTVSPGLVDIGPGILNYYFDTATENDTFSSGPSGLGYALIYDAHNRILFMKDEDKAAAYTRMTGPYLAKNGMRVITIWDQARDFHCRQYEKNCRSLYGLTMEDWFKNPKKLSLRMENNRLPFIPNCPAYAESNEALYEELYDAVSEFDGTKPLFIAAQGVTWRLSPENIKKLMDDFGSLQPDKIEVLRGDHFFALLNEANGYPFNIALSGKASVSVNDEKEAGVLLSGSPYGENLWEASAAGEREFIIDLGGTYELNRYVIKNAGVNDENDDRNNRAFSVSVSMDGKNWTAVDERAGNEESMIDVDFPKAEAAYVRLNVTEGGLDGIVRVGDFEIYGARKDLSRI